MIGKMILIQLGVLLIECHLVQLVLSEDIVTAEIKDFNNGSFEIRINAEDLGYTGHKVDTPLTQEPHTQIWHHILKNGTSSNALTNLIDKLTVWIIIYTLMKMFNGTRATNAFRGVSVIILVKRVSDFLGLNTVSWLMSQVIAYGVIAVIIIFQPEVRRGLEILGRGNFMKRVKKCGDKAHLISEFDRAIEYLSKRRIGALICIENCDSLADFIETGISLNADISSQLLINIFTPNTPLHDGAVIIQGEKISGASCYLPLSQNMGIPKEFGTRHRSAIGLSEVSDAFILIVSEETGDISIACENKFMPHLSRDEYLKILRNELMPQQFVTNATKQRFCQLLRI